MWTLGEVGVLRRAAMVGQREVWRVISGNDIIERDIPIGINLCATDLAPSRYLLLTRRVSYNSASGMVLLNKSGLLILSSQSNDLLFASIHEMLTLVSAYLGIYNQH